MLYTSVEKQCALLRQEGYSAADIAEKLGMKIRQVYRDIASQERHSD